MSDPAPGETHPRRPLTPAERLACMAAAVALGSMLLPWYGIPLTGGLSVSGFNAFGFAAAAMLVAVGAAVVVVIREAAGKPPVRPLRSADLVILAGGWAALVAIYLMFDRPDELAGSTRISLRIGPFVALGACVAMVVAGLRMRASDVR
jgi:hypothetical protein